MTIHYTATNGAQQLNGIRRLAGKRTTDKVAMRLALEHAARRLVGPFEITRLTILNGEAR